MNLFYNITKEFMYGDDKFSYSVIFAFVQCAFSMDELNVPDKVLVFQFMVCLVILWFTAIKFRAIARKNYPELLVRFLGSFDFGHIFYTFRLL